MLVNVNVLPEDFLSVFIQFRKEMMSFLKLHEQNQSEILASSKRTETELHTNLSFFLEIPDTSIQHHSM